MSQVLTLGQEIAEGSKKLVRARNFLWGKIRGWGYLALESSWPMTTIEGGRCYTLMHPLIEGSNDTDSLLYRKASFKLAILYVGIHLLIIEHMSCAVGIWLHVFEVKHFRVIKEWREVNSGVMPPWKEMLQSPVTAKDHEGIGNEQDTRNMKRLVFWERFFRWSELFQALKICTRKLKFSNGAHF